MNHIYLKSPQSDIEFTNYFKFRWQLLRQPLGLPLGSERDDMECDAYHCAAYLSRENIIGVGRINLENNSTMRIRYMAVARQYRLQGVGSMILRELLAHAQQQKIGICWLNSRKEALKFYQKNGFIIVKPIETDLPMPHFKMQIQL